MAKYEDVKECDSEKQALAITSRSESSSRYDEKQEILDKMSYVMASDAAQTSDETSPILDLFETNKKHSLKEIKNHVCEEVC